MRVLRPAAEVAAEMVSGPNDVAFLPDTEIFACSIGDLCGKVYLCSHACMQDAEIDRDDAVAVITRLIERERAEAYAAGKADGAKEERERR